MRKISVMMDARHSGDIQELGQALDSICTQSHFGITDLELIVFIDVSESRKSALLQEYCSGDYRITMLTAGREEPGALVRNRGIAECRGNYIAMMEAKDISAADRLVRQVSFLDKHAPVAFVGTNAVLFDDDHGVWGQRVHLAAPEEEDILFDIPFVHGSLMFRSTALRAVGGYRKKATERKERLDLVRRMYAAGYEGANIPEYLYFAKENASLYWERQLRHPFVRWLRYLLPDRMKDRLHAISRNAPDIPLPEFRTDGSIKYEHESKALAGSFDPITLKDEELVLTGIVLKGIAATDEIKLRLEIGWENTWAADMGDLEVIVRRGGPDGEIVEWSQETCLRRTVTKLVLQRTGGPPVQAYIVAVRSQDGRARVTGPCRFRGEVSGGGGGGGGGG